jgi:hypothetical protein
VTPSGTRSLAILHARCGKVADAAETSLLDEQPGAVDSARRVGRAGDSARPRSSRAARPDTHARTRVRATPSRHIGGSIALVGGLDVAYASSVAGSPPPATTVLPHQRRPMHLQRRLRGGTVLLGIQRAARSRRTSTCRRQSRAHRIRYMSKSARTHDRSRHPSGLGHSTECHNRRRSRSWGDTRSPIACTSSRIGSCWRT